MIELAQNAGRFGLKRVVFWAKTQGDLGQNTTSLARFLNIFP